MGLLGIFTVGVVAGGIVKWLYDKQTANDGTSADLEKISGIGPAYAGRLEAEGINTFAQLSSLSPEKIRETVRSSTVNAEDWIAQAKILAAE